MRTECARRAVLDPALRVPSQQVTEDDWEELEVAQLVCPTPDYDPPNEETIKSCTSFIRAHRHLGKVYIHCKAGRGRSSLVSQPPQLRFAS